MIHHGTWIGGGGVVVIAAWLMACTPDSPREIGPPEVSVAALDPALQSMIQEARASVVAAPDSGGAWGRLGQVLDATEFHAQARLCYREAARLEPAVAKWPHLLGLLQLQDEPEAAFTNLARAAELGGPGVEASRLRLAQGLVERGRGGEAVSPLLALITNQPGHAAARLELARIRLVEGQWAEAGSLAAGALTNPYTARAAMVVLSQVRAREGATDAAMDLSRRAAALPRGYDWPDPYLREVQGLRVDRARQVDRVAALLGQGKSAEAGVLLSNLLARLPDDPEVLLMCGRALLVGRDCEGAEARFREHLALVPNSLQGLMQLGIALLCQARWTDAIEVLGRVIALKPDFAEAHANLGLACLRSGDLGGAERSYRDAIRCSPGDAGTHAALAEVLARAGRTTEAREQVARALAVDPRHPRALAVQKALDPAGESGGRATRP